MVDMSKHASLPHRLSVDTQLLIVTADDHGHLAERPYVCYALIERQRLGIFFKEHRDLLITRRQIAPGGDIDQFRREHQFQPVLVTLCDRLAPTILNLLKCLFIGQLGCLMRARLLGIGLRYRREKDEEDRWNNK